MKAPVEVPPSGTQLTVGRADVPQQVPRAVIEAPPSDKIVAPNVAVVSVTDETVGDVRIGAEGPPFVINVPSGE